MTRNYTFNIFKALWAILCAAALGLVFLSCSKEQIVDNDNIISQPTEEDTPDSQDPDNPENPGEEPEIRPQVTIRVGLEEEGSRIGIEKTDGGTLHTCWVADDKLRVGRDAYAEEKIFTIQEGFTDHIAEFSGEALGDGESFYVIYPSNISWNYIFSKDYNGVKQVGNDNTEHIDYCVMLSGMTSFPSSLLLTDRYAESQGLTLRKSSVIKFYLKLPAEAATPTRLEIKAGKVGDTEGSDHIFYANNNEDSRTNALTLYLDSVTPDNQTITAYLSIPWFGYSVAAGQSLTISAYYDTESGDHKVVSKSITPGAGTFGGGQTILYQVNMTKGSTTSTNTDGDGTADNPYILSTADDLLAMKGKLLNEETVYFEMDADIDMASIPNWAPLNNSQQINFKRYINFNGNGHLIKNLRCTGEAYASFFGVLCGECCNTGFVNATVEGNAATCAGIIAAYVGLSAPTSAAQTGRIEQCYTTGYVTTGSSRVGGIAGQIGGLYGDARSAIASCYSAAVVDGDDCGGLAGPLQQGAIIKDSYFCGITTSRFPHWMGGITPKALDNYTTQPTVSNCASLTKTMIAPLNGGNSVIYRITNPTNMTVSGNLIWDGTTGNTRYSSDTQVATTLSAIQTHFTTTLGSSKGWSSTLDDGYPLLTWQVTRGDYATYAGHGQTYFDGGDGSAESPYLLSQPYQLYNMEPYMKTWAAEGDSTYFRLAGNIDLAVIDNWTPINQSDSDKRINLDGNGRTLSNLSLTNASSYAGLFGVFKGKVSNLTLKDFSVTQSANYGGGILAGFLANTGSAKARLKDITIDGGGVTMNGSSAVGSLGGFCGEIYASGCSSSASVIQNSKDNDYYRYCSGGLVAATRHDSQTAIFENCSFSGSVSGYDYCGGILGITRGAAAPRIVGCTVSGTVTARARAASGTSNALAGDSVGGIVGYHSRGILTDCTATASASISGHANVGGIIGYHYHDNAAYAFSGNKNYGAVSSTENCAGGIVGRYYSTQGSQISDCHSYYTEEKSVSVGGSYCGGIVGWLRTTTAPASGYTFSNCSSGATLQATGTGNYVGGIIGYVSEESGGTNHSVLSMDHCSSSGSISSRNNSCGGLIGGMRAKTFSMSNCSSSATANASGAYAGGLIAYLSGQYTAGNEEDISISDCTFSGTVSAGSNRAGGLFGEAYECPGTITACHTFHPTGLASFSASGAQAVGGLIGKMTSGTSLSLSDCSSTMAVKGQTDAGGLIGLSEAATLTLTGCSHTTGTVSYDSGATYTENQICGIGGLVGRVCGSGAISCCAVKDCNITGPFCIGGLVGYFGPTDSSTPTLTIQESYYHGGTVKAEGGHSDQNTRAVGGILGKNYANNSDYTHTVIQDCYSRGTITAASGQVAGGIVGEAMPGLTVAYCISDCSVSISRCAGGIIGRACNGGWTYSNDGKVKVERCICWSPSVTSTTTGNGLASSGAVIGFTSKANWLYKCYYNPNITFTGVNEKNTLVQQNSGGGYNTTYDDATAAIVPGTTAGTWTTSPYTYVMPYHGGTVANSNRSACTVAQAIGFASRTNASSQYVWKIFYGGVYSADHLMPELRNNRETDAEGNGEGIEDFPTNDIIDDGGNF